MLDGAPSPSERTLVINRLCWRLPSQVHEPPDEQKPKDIYPKMELHDSQVEGEPGHRIPEFYRANFEDDTRSPECSRPNLETNPERRGEAPQRFAPNPPPAQQAIPATQAAPGSGHCG